MSASDSTARLLEAARAARLNAQAGFSGFKVGAALEAADGTIFTGCNVESATYGQTMCAERVALFKALSDGQRAFSRVVVVTGAHAATPPCGACRQMLWEYGGNLEVILMNEAGLETGRHWLADLFPLPFDRRSLE